jgi:hypothetical protein
MSAINAQTSRQFNALAPSSIKVGRRTFARKGGLYDNAANLVRFDYTASKRPGAFLSDKITVSATYDEGLDLYTVKVECFDGKTLDAFTILIADGVGFDFFRDVGMHVSRAV